MLSTCIFVRFVYILLFMWGNTTQIRSSSRKIRYGTNPVAVIIYKTSCIFLFADYLPVTNHVPSCMYICICLFFLCGHGKYHKPEFYIYIFIKNIHFKTRNHAWTIAAIGYSVLHTFVFQSLYHSRKGWVHSHPAFLIRILNRLFFTLLLLLYQLG